MPSPTNPLRVPNVFACGRHHLAYDPRAFPRGGAGYARACSCKFDQIPHIARGHSGVFFRSISAAARPALMFPLLRLGKPSWRTRRLRTCLWAASPRERARVVVKRVLFFDEEGTEDVVGADEDGGVILVVETLRILASMIRRPRERRTKKWSGGDAPEVVAPKHDRQSGTMDPHTRRDRRRRRRHQDPQNLPRRDCRRSRPRERRDARPD